VTEGDYDEVLARIDRAVRERRARGDYPIGLEQQLEAEFRGTLSAAHAERARREVLRAATASIEAATHAIDVTPSTASRVPLGSLVHGATARLVTRQTGPLAEAIRHLGDTIAAAYAGVVDALAAQQSADERRLLDVLAGVLDRLAVLDHLVELVGDLDERVAALEHRPDPAR
jgi:hypothetical protein